MAYFVYISDNSFQPFNIYMGTDMVMAASPQKKRSLAAILVFMIYSMLKIWLKPDMSNTFLTKG